MTTASRQPHGVRPTCLAWIQWVWWPGRYDRQKSSSRTTQGVRSGIRYLAWHGDVRPALPLPDGSDQVFHRDHPVRTGLVTSKPVGLALVLVT